MSDNRIELSGIFSEGYGIIPKKLMKLKISIYAKSVIAYLLSYTGAGKLECWPTQETISKDLYISTNTVKKAIKELIFNDIISKEKMYINDPMKKNNKYRIKIFETKDDINNYFKDKKPCDDLSIGTTDTTVGHNKALNNNIYNNNINNNNNENLSETEEYIHTPINNQPINIVDNNIGSINNNIGKTKKIKPNGASGDEVSANGGKASQNATSDATGLYQAEKIYLDLFKAINPNGVYSHGKGRKILKGLLKNGLPAVEYVISEYFKQKVGVYCGYDITGLQYNWNKLIIGKKKSLAELQAEQQAELIAQRERMKGVKNG